MDVNLEAEQSVLGCMLVETELVKECRLEPHHFYHPDHRHIFETIKLIDAKNEPMDIVAVITYMNPDKLKKMGGKALLSKLIKSVASTKPFKSYEKYVLNAYKIRRAKQLKEDDLNDVESITELIRALSELEQDDVDDEYNHQETIVELHQDLETEKRDITGVDTGFRDLNKFLGGYQPGDLIICAARPSVGKTAKALNHAIKACENDSVVPIFSLEMPKKQLLTRMMAAIGNINSAKLRNPLRRFDENDWKKLSIAEGMLSDMNLHIYDKSGQTISFIRSKVRRIRKQYPDKQMLVIIDYLQLIRSEGRSERRDLEIGEITRSLKEMARDLNVAVMLLSQLSRGVESRQDKRPMMSDIRDSGSVEQDADVIEFLYRDDYYDKSSDKPNVIEIIIAKQRNGPVGTVELAFIKEYNKFLDLDYRYDNQRTI
ncbi:replicative DNA helicase [Radiobacillus sp. PE A8.2]|uniref:replicative DNA helicase n=1 Tax=Radiobacillus sp. PE A8.2 TaxID=3380349 RepID=UPI00388F2FC7